MNADVFKRSAMYNYLADRFKLSKNTIKSHFRRKKRDVGNMDDVNKFVNLYIMHSPGVYVIENLVNGKKYIGQSHNVQWRWSKHKSLLKSKKHPVEELQQDYNHHGADNFVFTLYKFVGNKEERLKEESDLINMYPVQTLYNMDNVLSALGMMDKELLKRIVKYHSQIKDLLDGAGLF